MSRALCQLSYSAVWATVGLNHATNRLSDGPLHRLGSRPWRKIEVSIPTARRPPPAFEAGCTAGCVSSGSGGCESRTREDLRPTGFPGQRHRPLGEPSRYHVAEDVRFERTRTGAQPP